MPLLESSKDSDFTKPIRAAFDEEYKTCPADPLVTPEIDEIITIDASLSKYFFEIRVFNNEMIDKTFTLNVLDISSIL